MFAHCIQIVLDAEQHSLALRQARGDKIAALRLAREALQILEATEDAAAQERVRQFVAAWEPSAQ